MVLMGVDHLLKSGSWLGEPDFWPSTVVLPYAAFDLQAEHPIYANTTNYFPIRRAVNESQYTLGRAFMQEAYIVADYGRGNFSVHQALFPPTTAQKQIMPITMPGLVLNGSTHNSTSSKSLSGGSIAGIVVAVVVALVIFCFSLTAFVIRRRRKNRQDGLEQRYGDRQHILPELREEQKLCIEHSGEERYEMHEPLHREIDGIPKAELEVEKQAPQELPTDLPKSINGEN
jgi:hypothetical protein